MTDLKTPTTPDGGRGRKRDLAAGPHAADRRRQRELTPQRLAQTGTAMVVAVVIAIVLRRALGWHSTVAVGIVAYGAFVLTLVIAHARQASPHPQRPTTADRRPVIDLTEGASDREVLDHLRILDPATAFARSGSLPPPPPRAAEARSANARAWLDAPPELDQPRQRPILTADVAVEVGVAVVAALALAMTLRTLLAWNGILGTAVWWYLGFLATFFALVRDQTDPLAAADRVVTVVIWSIGAVVVAVLGWMMTFLLMRGSKDLSLSFLTQDLSKVGPLDSGGGARHAIIGTFEQVGLATVASVPIAVLTAVYLHEIQGRMAKPVRFVIDAMSGLPSIVAGLLVFTVWNNGRGFSGVSGAAALAVLMLPTVTRTSEEILRTIPDSLREASLALGAPQWRVVLRVVVPTALSGLVTAAILGVARAVGETAPMLLTAFGADTTNVDPTKGPQSDLPLFVWKLIRVPNKAQNDRAWTGALVLVLLVLVLFTTARFAANRSRKKLGRAR
ncbi:MAG: Phosphate transport system permease protein PstA [Acidimicrobiales bacterium]|nr:Phosphate transport system permease protein PstA [Acidimicrobiales bacterium]